MTVHDQLQLIPTGQPNLSAEVARSYAERYLAAEPGSAEQTTMAAALTVLLDDPGRPVRLAIAKVLAASNYAPAHVIRSLANDVDEIAVLVLRQSPLLDETELVDLLAEGSSAVQMAIAERADLTAGVSAALCEVADEDACMTLLHNPHAKVLKSSLVRLAERFEAYPDLCDQLLKHADLPIPVRYELLMGMTRQLENHPVVLERVPDHQRATFLSDAVDKVVLRLALEARDEELPAFVAHLRENGRLNTRLLLRSVCCGRLRFFAAALADLGNMPLPRLCKVLLTVRRAALQAVLRKAGLPYRSHQAFLLAIDIARKADADFSYDLALEEARVLTETLLSEMQDGAFGTDEDVTAFLRRFAVDVARLEARALMRKSAPALRAVHAA